MSSIFVLIKHYLFMKISYLVKGYILHGIPDMAMVTKVWQSTMIGQFHSSAAWWSSVSTLLAPAWFSLSHATKNAGRVDSTSSVSFYI